MKETSINYTWKITFFELYYTLWILKTVHTIRCQETRDFAIFVIKKTLVQIILMCPFCPGLQKLYKEFLLQETNDFK